MEINKKNKTGLSSVDKPWLKYYPENIEKLNVPQVSMTKLLYDSCQEYLDNIALSYFNTKKTYRQYIKDIENYYASLSHMNPKKGEVILTMLPNIPESRELVYSAVSCNCRVYPLLPMISPAELDRIISENEVRTIVLFDGFYEKYKSVLEANSNLKNIIGTDGTYSLSSVMSFLSKIKNKSKSEISKSKKYIPFKEFDAYRKYVENCSLNLDIENANDVAVIINTSGTTGSPKGVCLTHNNLNTMAYQHKYGDMFFDVGDKLLDLLPQSIGYGISVTHYSGVCGLEAVLVPTLETDIKKFLDKQHISHFTGGPIHYETLYHKYMSKGIPVNRGKNFVSGGASFDKNIEKNINGVTDSLIVDEAKVFVRQGLGCTENGGAATYAKHGAYKFGGVGIPLALENMGVFELGTDKELTYNQLGEICISGPTVMKEYLNNQEETDKVLLTHSDGKVWLHTKDIGYVDEDGQFFILDRAKNLFARRGFNVHPTKISYTISELKDIVNACYVMGIPHPIEQKVPVAFIELKDDIDTSLAEKTILDYCNFNLEETSVPYQLVFVDKLPRNVGGKVDEKQLLDKYPVDYFQENVQKKVLK